MRTLHDVRIANERKKTADLRVDILDTFCSDGGYSSLASILDGTESNRNLILDKVAEYLDYWCRLGSPWRWTNHGSGIYNDALRYVNLLEKRGLVN